MDPENISHASKIIKPSYAELGYNSIQKRAKMLKELLTQRQLLQQPLDQLTISYIMDELALMDSNNFHEKIGVGERQARIFSTLVQRRNFYMGHGIGRSGDVMANQPKAAGSSLLLQLTKFMTISALKEINYQFVKDVLLLPMATGMALTMVFLTLAEKFPEKKYVIWSRIDQKTCLKSIVTANLIPIVIQQQITQDYIHCNHQKIQQKIQEVGVDKILCIVSTTSCFAPRIPDNVQTNSILAKKYGIFHVVNNAYGLWCTKIAYMIKQGLRNGECTAVVQSMDKNFMVPVGGSIIFTQKQQTLKQISSKYPGRASGSPIVDLFLTLLGMGKSTLYSLKSKRKQNYKYMYENGVKFAEKHNFRILKTQQNTISIAMELKNAGIDEITELGAVLYSKRVMGHRILSSTPNTTNICGNLFKNYGTHSEQYPFLPYITFACAVGTEKEQIDVFFQRLEESLKDLLKKQKKKQKKQQEKQKEKQKQKVQQKEQKNEDKIQEKVTQEEKSKQKQTKTQNADRGQQKNIQQKL